MYRLYIPTISFQFYFDLFFVSCSLPVCHNENKRARIKANLPVDGCEEGEDEMKVPGRSEKKSKKIRGRFDI